MGAQIDKGDGIIPRPLTVEGVLETVRACRDLSLVERHLYADLLALEALEAIRYNRSIDSPSELAGAVYDACGIIRRRDDLAEAVVRFLQAYER